jgi:hypothetical protein
MSMCQSRSRPPPRPLSWKRARHRRRTPGCAPQGPGSRRRLRPTPRPATHRRRAPRPGRSSAAPRPPRRSRAIHRPQECRGFVGAEQRRPSRHPAARIDDGSLTEWREEAGRLCSCRAHDTTGSGHDWTGDAGLSSSFWRNRAH